MPLCVAAVVVGTHFACAHPPTAPNEPPPPIEPETPSWVRDGTGVFGGEFRAVGISSQANTRGALLEAEDVASRGMIELVAAHPDQAFRAKPAPTPRPANSKERCPKQPEIEIRMVPWEFTAAWRDGNGTLHVLAILARRDLTDWMGTDPSGALRRVWAEQQASARKLIGNGEIAPAPGPSGHSWPDQGTFLQNTAHRGPTFYAVGAGAGIKNAALSLVTAQNRAYADVMRLFEDFSAALMKQYMETTSPESDATAMSELGYIQAFCPRTVSGIIIVDNWTGADGAARATAALSVDTIIQQLHVLVPNPDVRDYAVAHAAEVFQSLLEARRGASKAP